MLIATNTSAFSSFKLPVSARRTPCNDVDWFANESLNAVCTNIQFHNKPRLVVGLNVANSNRPTYSVKNV